MSPLEPEAQCTDSSLNVCEVSKSPLCWANQILRFLALALQEAVPQGRSLRV